MILKDMEETTLVLMASIDHLIVDIRDMEVLMTEKDLLQETTLVLMAYIVHLKVVAITRDMEEALKTEKDLLQETTVVLMVQDMEAPMTEKDLA